MHALAFRVMRLSKPAVAVHPCPMKLDLAADMVVDNATDLATSPSDAAQLHDAEQHPFAARVQLSRPSDGMGCQGVLELPQSFGSIHLGEVRALLALADRHPATLAQTFTSYISVGNYAEEAVTSVGIKVTRGSTHNCQMHITQAELQTERHKTILYDITSVPLPSLEPGARHDFVVKHDVKELGPHTLVCSTVYTSTDGERKYMPQYFKFSASNPLSVRTKVRRVLTL